MAGSAFWIGLWLIRWLIVWLALTVLALCLWRAFEAVVTWWVGHDD